MFKPLLALVLATPILLAACSAPGSDNDDKGSGDGPIKIAVVNAQSGQLSSLGAWEHKGVKLAADEWNKAGGINGRKIELGLFDDQGDPTVGTNLARKIASEGYIAMLGTAESAVTIAMAPILRDSKIPNITSGQSPGLVAVKSPFLFLNGPTSTTYDETLAKYIVDSKGIKSIAMITNNGGYGKGEHDAFLKALQSRGVTPVDDQIVTGDQKDFSAALTTIRQKSPQVIFIGAEEVQSGLIVKQARDLGITVPFAGAAPTPSPGRAASSRSAAGSGTSPSVPGPSPISPPRSRSSDSRSATSSWSAASTPAPSPTSGSRRRRAGPSSSSSPATSRASSRCESSTRPLASGSSGAGSSTRSTAFAPRPRPRPPRPRRAPDDAPRPTLQRPGPASYNWRRGRLAQSVRAPL
jgi:branched-chain amino acid transport system substrate-binding protein